MQGHGGPYPFRPVGWDSIAAFLAGLAAQNRGFQYMADIAESVITSESTKLLAGCTSMHDLIVVSTPIPKPPYEVIAVRAPGSLPSPAEGKVLIEHVSCTGRNDQVERPASEVVRLFWRFVIEKYGVHPLRQPAHEDN